MHRTKFTLAVMTVATLLLAPGVSVASPETEPVSDSAAARCASGYNCTWSGRNYTGNPGRWRDVRPGCFGFKPGFQPRSYSFFGGEEGYFYAGKDCTGRSRPARRNTESGDIGFTAYSYLSACIVCRSSR